MSVDWLAMRGKRSIRMKMSTCVARANEYPFSVVGIPFLGPELPHPTAKGEALSHLWVCRVSDTLSKSQATQWKAEGGTEHP